MIQKYENLTRYQNENIQFLVTQNLPVLESSLFFFVNIEITPEIQFQPGTLLENLRLTLFFRKPRAII